MIERIEHLPRTRWRIRFLRAGILIAGLLATQFALYAPSLLGSKVLLPLELLVDPGTQSGGAGGGSILPHDRLQTDPINQIEPMRRFAVSEVRAGRLPLWDPNNYCGAPFLAANQGGVFSPYRLLDYLWPDPWALAWGQMLKALVGGIGAYLFFRRAMRVHFWAAAIGAWIWPQSGFLVLWAMWPLSAVVTWLPWVMLGVNRCVCRPGTGPTVLLAIVSAFAIVSGHSATGAQALLASGLYAFWMLWVRRGRRTLPAIVSLAGGWLLGGCLAAPQLLPTLDYMSNSLRMVNRLQSGAEIAPVGLSALPQMLLPWVHGTTRSGWIYLLSDNPLESAVAGYVGVVMVLVLAPLGFIHRRRRAEQLFWLILAIIAAAYVLNLPGGWWLNRLPILQSLRGNRMIFISGFALLVMGVRGLDIAIRGGVKRSPWGLAGPAMGLFLAGWCVWRGFMMGEIIAPIVAPAVYASQSERMVNAISQLIDRFRMLQFTYAAICIGGVMLGVMLWRITSRKLAIAVGLLAVVEVLATAWPVNPQSDRALYDWKMPALEQIAAAGPGRMCGVLCLPPMMPRWFNLSDIRGYDAVDPLRYVQFTQLLAASNSPPPDSVAATFAYLPKYPSKLADFLNLRYLVFRGQPADPAGVRFITPDYFVLENSTVLPRVTVPKHAIISPDSTERLAALGDPTFDPLQTVYLETDQPLLQHEIDGSATMVNEVPSRLQIDYAMKTDGYVVLADTWDAGWRATVNGEPTEVLRANHAFRAIAVKAGNGTIILTYWPRSFTLGLFLAGAAGTCILIFAASSLRRRDIIQR